MSLPASMITPHLSQTAGGVLSLGGGGTMVSKTAALSPSETVLRQKWSSMAKECQCHPPTPEMETKNKTDINEEDVIVANSSHTGVPSTIRGSFATFIFTRNNEDNLRCLPPLESIMYSSKGEEDEKSIETRDL
ncbi:hypothetical protein LSM04_004799 [Trypanosoma melophagium]|uniref:uncharacterized protein n=1 Tax=Trypanosoma melophagium TaxID=715481 RepID=UPI00351A3016|nr:hypothetical protein LSM04_004799 [Trypanosoma melophagium]